MMVIRWPKHVGKWLLNNLYILVTDTEQVLCWNSAFVGTNKDTEDDSCVTLIIPPADLYTQVHRMYQDYIV
jgi:hypothetical protein